MKRSPTLVALSIACLATPVWAAEGFTVPMTITTLEVGRTGEHIVVSVASPPAECSYGVFRLYRNEFGLTSDGQRFNLAQLQLAFATGRPVVLYHSGGPLCYVANVRLL